MKRAYIFLLAMMGPLMALEGEGHHGSYHGHSNDLPQAVIHTLADRYHHFDLIHINRSYHYGRPVYDMIIQHHDGFAKVLVGNGGHFYRETYYDTYPLDNHYCDDNCGFQYQHYQNGNFATYDPYSGCDYHIGQLSNRYPRYRWQPYYGYGSLYYNPWYGHYKRFKRYQSHYGRGYYLHNRPYKYYGHKYKNRGYRNYGYYGRNHKGHGKYGYGHNKHKGHKHYNGRDNDHWDRDRDHSKRKRQSHYGDNSKHDHYQKKEHRQNDRAPQRRRYEDHNDDDFSKDRRKEWDRRRGREKYENPGKDPRVRERRRS